MEILDNIAKWMWIFVVVAIGIFVLIFILLIALALGLYIFEIYEQRKARTRIPEYKLYYKVAHNVTDQKGQRVHFINKDHGKFEKLIGYFVKSGYVNECREVLLTNHSNLETLFLFPKSQLNSDVQKLYQKKMSFYYKATLKELEFLQAKIKNAEIQAAVKDLDYLDTTN